MRDEYSGSLKGSVLAFDFGKTRIGVAQGNTQIAIAHPVCTITGKNNQDKFNQISGLVKEWQPDFLLVGRPCHLDGTEHEMTQSAEKFARRLYATFRLPVGLLDERLTSIAAEQRLTEAQTFGKKRKQALDQVAAMEILQSFFDDCACDKVIDGKD
ncbi:MAG: Holliday junction resolvase RuvX [Neisseriaceae bacterium]|nr:Holliday junction resolvase RuvX [Neisseriaceae bacterium]